MSLEQAIERNTAALEALHALLSNPTVVVHPATIEPVNSDLGRQVDAAAKAIVAETKAKRAKKEAAQAPAPLEQSVPSPETGADSASETADAAAPVDDAPVEPVTRDQLSRALTTVASRRGRAVALGILQNVKASTLAEVDPGDYAALVAACELELARG